MRTASSSIHRGGGGWPSVMAFCCGLLLCPSVMALWFGGLLIEGGPLVESGLLLWPSGMAFWYVGILVLRVRNPTAPRRPYQKAAFNQKTTKPEGHNRRPHPPGTRHPPGADPPQTRHPPWEQTPPEQTHPPVNTILDTRL